MSSSREGSVLRGCCAVGLVALGLALGSGIVEGEEKQEVNELVFAQMANPPSLDAMTSSSQTARNITMNIYEQLVTIDENAEPILMLAESLETSPDGMSYIFRLRKGVMFHNGDEMRAGDVKASLERYREYGATPGLLDNVAHIEVSGEYEVKLHMSESTPTFIETFSSTRAPAVIMPVEEAAKPADDIDYIGTGPYMFVEYIPDSHVKLKRFEDYSPDMRYEERTGFGGKKTAYAKRVTFRILPETGARVAALEAGEIDWVDQVPVPTARRMSEDPNFTVYEQRELAFLTLVLNWKLPPTDNVHFRRALLHAIDRESVMALATEGAYELNHGWQYPGRIYDVGEVGAECYGPPNPHAVRFELEKAGYSGEEFVLLTDTQIPEHGRAAVAIAELIENAGINVAIRQLDWPTALKIRVTDEGWNGWTITQGIEAFLGPYGLSAKMTGSQPHQRGTHPAIDEAYNDLITGNTVKERRAAFARIQRLIYELVPQIKIGDVGRMQVATANMRGFEPFAAPRVYNVWVENNAE